MFINLCRNRLFFVIYIFDSFQIAYVSGIEYNLEENYADLSDRLVV